MSQETRTNYARRLNNQIGIVVTSITIPEKDVQETLNHAAYLRAEHMLSIIKRGDMNRVRLLSKKRSPYSHSSTNNQALEQLQEDREGAMETLQRYREIEQEIDLGDYDFDEIDMLRAEKVALGHMLVYYLGEATL